MYPEIVTITRANDNVLRSIIEKTPGVKDITATLGLKGHRTWIDRVYHIRDSALRIRVIRDLAGLNGLGPTPLD
ncbi:MAG TPA: hypothetical protein VFH43_10120 [Candidatus Kapabacteria bacterium]|nr:hypothetical protein [Candidatus Kapabacteria bacterium]